MVLREYNGRGGNAGSAVSSMYHAASTNNPTGDISYTVGIKEKDSTENFTTGAPANDYNEALQNALDESGLSSYRPGKHQLEVIATAKFDVAETVQPRVRAGGSAPTSRTSTQLSDLF